MVNKLASLLLLLLMMMMVIVVITPTTSAKDSVRMTPFRISRTTKNGPEMCVLDTADQTILSSSLQHCSITCSKNLTCTSFSIKNSHTCDVYIKAKIIVPVSACINYQKISTENVNECFSFAELPYTLGGELRYNCTVNTALSSDFGCYHLNGQWVTCQQPEDFTAEYEETSTTALSANPAVSVPLLTINGWIVIQRKVTGGSVSFDTNWAAYRDGFGSASGNDNYWLGLDKVYRLMQIGSVKLRVEVGKTTDNGLHGQIYDYFSSVQ